MKAAVIRHGEDKWGSEPVVIIADNDAQLESKIADFLRETIDDDDMSRIMSALAKEENEDEGEDEDEDEEEAEPTTEEIEHFRKTVDADDLIDAYDEHVCPGLNPWEQWHINHSTDVR